MTDVATAVEPSPQGTLDRQDVRVEHSASVGAITRGFVRRVRAGDLGALPVVVGLVVIGVVFQIANSVFLSSNNLVNLLFDCSPVGIIALGIVCVLMVGEIDLSVGSVSGLASAVVGVLWVEHGMPVLLACVIAVAIGAAIGALYAVLFTRFGMPSFVATLAGLLAFVGLQLQLLGQAGSVNLPFSSGLVRFGQTLFLPHALAIVLAAVVALATLASSLRTRQRRHRAGLSVAPLVLPVARAVALLVGLEALVLYLDRDRGLPWMFALFAALVALLDYALRRTRWGRSMTALGGNREATRRAGIRVNASYLSAFVLCSMFATLGGVLGAARLASASQQAGTGDVNLDAIAAAVIGGTSLFGGRGSARSALLGIVVIQSISSGLTLLNLSSSLRYMITGAVLALAVLVDSLARRSRAAHGAA